MPLQIVHEDITKFHCDVIVNPTDCFYSGGGGTDLAVHQAAGAELDKACQKLAPIDFGEVAVTPGFRLPCQYIIHTMGPIWQDGTEGEPVLLRSCYINALLKAKSLNAKTVAFPLISAGTFGFPKDKVLRIALDSISEFLYATDSEESEMNVYICVIHKDSYELSREIALQEYLQEEPKPVEYQARLLFSGANVASTPKRKSSPDIKYSLTPNFQMEDDALAELSLEKWLKKQDDSFALLLFKLMDKKEMDYVECYKKANVSKNTFSKINNDKTYKPSKPTVIAFAIALELSLEETNTLLKSAGFALSGSTFDKIIEFYIKNGDYDLWEINEALYKYDQPCLGC